MTDAFVRDAWVAAEQHCKLFTGVHSDQRPMPNFVAVDARAWLISAFHAEIGFHIRRMPSAFQFEDRSSVADMANNPVEVP